MKVKLSEGQFSKLVTKYLRLEKVIINKVFIPDKGELAEDTILIKVDVDHAKTFKNSPEFDPKYYMELNDFGDDKYESSLETIANLLGVPYYVVKYIHLNLEVYNPLLRFLHESELAPILETYQYTPFVEISYDPYLKDEFSSEEDVYTFIQKNGFDTEDIILTHRW